MTLKAAWDRAHRAADDRTTYYGTLGRHNADLTITIPVTGRVDMVYVTLVQKTIIQARNEAGVPQTDDLPVKLKLDHGIYIIVGRSTRGELGYPTPTPPSGVLPHASTHQHGGTDEVATATPAANAIPKADASGLLDGWVTHTDVGAAIHAATGKTTPVDADELALIDSAASNVLKKLTWANLKATVAAYYDALTTTMTNKTLTSPVINTPTIVVKDNAFTLEDDGDTTKKALFQLSGIATGQTRTITLPDASFTPLGLTLTQSPTNKTFDSTNKGSLTAKGTPVDADSYVLVDSAASNVLKGVTGTALKAYLKTYFDTLYDKTATIITALATKTTPVDADAVVITDSAASDAPKRVTYTNVKAFLKTYFDTLYDLTATAVAALTGKTTPVDADGFVIADSAASNAPKKVTGTNLKAYLKTYFDTLYNLYVHPNHTGDVTSVGDGATTIGANKVVTGMIANANVTRAKLSDGTALSVVGRSANSVGVPADVAATAASGAVLRESGSVLGFGTVATAGIADAAVTNAKRADMAQATLSGRASGAGTGVPTDLTAAQARTVLNVADGANAYVHPNHSGDVTSVGDGATTIGASKVLTTMIADANVTLAKMANLAQTTVIGRASGAGTGVPTALTATQLNTILATAVTYLLADGTIPLSGDWVAGASRTITIGTVTGSAASGGNLTLNSTSHATKGKILFGASAAYDGANKRLGIGTASPASTMDVQGTNGDIANFEVDGTFARMYFTSYRDSASTHGLFKAQAARGSKASPTAIQSGDSLFAIRAEGYGTAFGTGSNAEIAIEADGVATGTSLPGRIVLYTTPSGSVTQTEAMRINALQQVIIGLTSAGANVLGIKAGISSNDAAVGGTLYVDSGTHGNTTTGETDLGSYTCTANELAVNNQYLEVKASFNFTTASATKTLKMYFGSDSWTVFSFMGAPASAITIWLVAQVIRTGATSQKVVISAITAGGNVTNIVTISTASRTLSSSNVLKFTGQGGASSQVTQETMTTQWHDANS